LEQYGQLGERRIPTAGDEVHIPADAGDILVDASFAGPVARLTLDEGYAGTHTITLDDGRSRQSFFVKDSTPGLVKSVVNRCGKPLPALLATESPSAWKGATNAQQRFDDFRLQRLGNAGRVRA
jgi:hypothetical protein